MITFIRIISLIFLLLNLINCQDESKNKKIKEKVENTSTHNDEVQIEDLTNRIKLNVEKKEASSSEISELIYLLDKEKIKDYKIINLLRELEILNNHVIFQYFVKNIFFEIDHEIKLRSWDYEEFPFYKIIYSSNRINQYNISLLESELLNDCTINDDKINNIYKVLNHGSINYDLDKLIKNSNIYFPSNPYRILNLEKLRKLEAANKKLNNRSF